MLKYVTLVHVGQQTFCSFLNCSFFFSFFGGFWLSAHVCLCQCRCYHMICIFLPRLMPEIAAFVVVGLIPLSAPASWTHCVSFCYPQEGRTGASVFGLAMSKSALLVLSQWGYTHTHIHTLPLSLSSSLSECLFLTENNMSSSVSVEGLHNTKPFHVWMRVCDGCHILAKFSGAVSLR